MKRFTKWFAAIACIACAAGAAVSAGAEGSLTAKSAARLQAFLLTQTADAEAGFDRNADGILTAADLSCMKHELIESTSISTTTTAPATTTKASTTTTKAATTTTATTTKATTPSTTTTTLTTAMTATTAPSLDAEYSIVNDAINKISITNTKAPKYNENLYEVDNQIYLFKVGDKVYAYTLLAKDNKSTTGGELIHNEAIGGLHIWLYEGNNVPEAITDNAPSGLEAFSKINTSDIDRIAKVLAGRSKENSTDRSCYDYNLNGAIDQEDLEIVMKYVISNPYRLFWWLNKEAFNIFFDNLPTMSEFTNVVWLYTEQAGQVEYAYCIPTGGLVDANYQGVVTKVPDQVLPKSMEQTLSEKYKKDKFASDGNADYLLWEPTYKKWAYGSNTSPTNWEFRAGYYVYVLGSDGHFIKNWVE